MACLTTVSYMCASGLQTPLSALPVCHYLSRFRALEDPASMVFVHKRSILIKPRRAMSPSNATAGKGRRHPSRIFRPSFSHDTAMSFYTDPTGTKNPMICCLCHFGCLEVSYRITSPKTRVSRLGSPAIPYRRGHELESVRDIDRMKATLTDSEYSGTSRHTRRTGPMHPQVSSILDKVLSKMRGGERL